jgi:hypothetical protein
MATPSSMILRALQLTGEKEPGGTLTSDEQTTYLSVLNVMLDSWSVDRLMIYQLLQESFSLTDGTGQYSIGSGADFNTTRPTRILPPCFTRDSSNYDRPLTLLDPEQYGMIVLKQTQSSFPEYLFYDNAYVAGISQIRLYPVPGPDLTLYMNSWKALQQFTTITDVVALPPGYQRAIEFNLAIELAGGFTNVSQEVAKIARESMKIVKGFNAPRGTLRMEAGVAGRRRWNINTGD